MSKLGIDIGAKIVAETFSKLYLMISDFFWEYKIWKTRHWTQIYKKNLKIFNSWQQITSYYC